MQEGADLSFSSRNHPWNQYHTALMLVLPHFAPASNAAVSLLMPKCHWRPFSSLVMCRVCTWTIMRGNNVHNIHGRHGQEGVASRVCPVSRFFAPSTFPDFRFFHARTSPLTFQSGSLSSSHNLPADYSFVIAESSHVIHVTNVS